VAGTLFILPGFVSILALSILYAGYQELTVAQAIFFGIKADAAEGVPVADAVLDDANQDHARPRITRSAAVAAVWLGLWLAPGEMLDGLGMAETTPGPLIQVTQFVAYLGAYRDAGSLDPFTAGVLASVLATWVTFVPCFLWIFLGAPYVESLRDNASLSAALSAITAAVVGVILNLAIRARTGITRGRHHRRGRHAAGGWRVRRTAAFPTGLDSGDQRQRDAGRCVVSGGLTANPQPTLRPWSSAPRRCPVETTGLVWVGSASTVGP
jgi:chromate transport protein ChrA